MSLDVARRARRAWAMACLSTAIGWSAMLIPFPARAIAMTPHPHAHADVHVHVPVPVRVIPERDPEPYWLNGQVRALVYPPRTASSDPQPVTVVLHGMCGRAENVCAPFAPARTGWLVCPAGPTSCPNGGATWMWSDSQRLVDAALAQLSSAYPERVAKRGGTLAGFSWGALAALDLAHRSRGEWSYLVLLGADVQPDAERLARAGVVAVAMGAGDYDMMSARMKAAAERLDRRGVRATFLSFGPVGHTFAPDMPAWIVRAKNAIAPGRSSPAPFGAGSG